MTGYLKIHLRWAFLSKETTEGLLHTYQVFPEKGGPYIFEEAIHYNHVSLLYFTVQCCLSAPLCASNQLQCPWGSFINYIDQILAISDPQPTPD